MAIFQYCMNYLWLLCSSLTKKLRNLRTWDFVHIFLAKEQVGLGKVEQIPCCRCVTSSQTLICTVSFNSFTSWAGKGSTVEWLGRTPGRRTKTSFSHFEGLCQKWDERDIHSFEFFCSGLMAPDISSESQAQPRTQWWLSTCFSSLTAANVGVTGNQGIATSKPVIFSLRGLQHWLYKRKTASELVLLNTPESQDMRSRLHYVAVFQASALKLVSTLRQWYTSF